MIQLSRKYPKAYKGAQNIVCVHLQNRQIKLYVKVDPDSIEEIPDIVRDVTNKGTYGTGDFELLVSTEDDLEVAKPYIEMAYQEVGG